ncbi:MAG: substrate-binding domain-containing protein [Spirochaetales bacterium]
MKRISLTRIAQEAGVSVSTVSRVVNGEPGIAETTREHVRTVMHRLGYHARPERIITLLLTDSDENVFRNTFFLRVVRGANRCAVEHGYHLMVSFCSDGKDQAGFLESLVPAWISEGLILTSIERGDRSVEYLSEQNVPFCVIGRPENTSRLLWVDNDNFQAMYNAVGELIDRGNREIAFIGADWSRTYIGDRYDGYRQALRRRGFTLDPALCEPSADDAHGFGSAEALGYERAKRVLARANPDAIVATDDILALGALRALREAGREDIALLGVNNSPHVENETVSISSIETNAEILGYSAAELLVDAVEGRISAPAHRIVETEIVHRESTSPGSPGRHAPA